MSAPADLRTHLATLEALGDIQRIAREVSPNLEAAAITRRSTETLRPAPFFEHVHGVEPGFRMFGAPCALSSIPGHPLARVALSFGLPHTANAAAIGVPTVFNTPCAMRRLSCDFARRVGSR